jgi:hypothetical protein
MTGAEPHGDSEIHILGWLVRIPRKLFNDLAGLSVLTSAGESH